MLELDRQVNMELLQVFWRGKVVSHMFLEYSEKSGLDVARIHFIYKADPAMI